MRKKALIFGGRSGLLGQALARVLTAHGWSVVSIGRSEGDLLNVSFIEKSFLKYKPHVLFNTTAMTQVDNAEDDAPLAYTLNRALPACLAQIAKKSDVHLIHYSTDFVFSGTATRCYTEDSPTEPLSVYGQSKLSGEKVVLELAPDNTCVLRTAWLFGPGKRNFVTAILDKAQGQAELSVVHDQIGSPTYTMDLAVWSMRVAEKRLTGLYHAVNAGRASWCELASEAVSIAESSCRINPISSDQWPQKAKRPAFSVLNAQKLATTLGITIRPWPQALREYLFSEYLNRDLMGH